jgi:peptide/nickel transport system permease protein
MNSKGSLVIPVGCLASIHAIVLLAGFIAPYGYAVQDRELPFAPPTRIHFVDGRGRFHFWPFVYRYSEEPGQFRIYSERTDIPYPVRLFHRHQETVTTSANPHLFGVDAPARLYLLGTDNYGRDVFSRLLYGGRISLFAGLLATSLSLAVATVLGVLSGYHGAWVDGLLMRLAELFLALPWLYLLFALRAFLPLLISPTQAFLLLIAVIGLIGWARPARLVRGVVLSAKERGYVLASRGFGASDLYILRRHVLPQTAGVLLTQAALLIPQYILAEVTLSFLGLGVGEPVPSWGTMLAQLQQYHVLVSYWWMFLPGVALIPIFVSYGKVSSVLQERFS